MRIEDAIQAVHALRKPWVRLAQVRKIPNGLELCFGVHREDRGRKKIGTLTVRCPRVREAHITAVDGGGLALNPATHPAAHQYTARKAELRWVDETNKARTLGALYQAHIDALYDWIPFDRYVSPKALSGRTCLCKGPEFLMRAYAKALRAKGYAPRLAIKKRTSKVAQLRVLHFGESFVVAHEFTAEYVALRP